MKHKGFTLIELMVVMAIITFLSVTAIVNFGKNEDREVRMEKDRLTSFLREVQNKALAGEKEGVSFDGRLCGFGVHATSSSSSLMAFYMSTSGLNDSCTELVTNNPSLGTDYPPVFHLNNGVTIQSGFDGRLFFLIPYGNVYYDGKAVITDIPITINLTKTGLSSPPIQVQIDQAGKIY